MIVISFSDRHCAHRSQILQIISIPSYWEEYAYSSEKSHWLRLRVWVIKEWVKYTHAREIAKFEGHAPHVAWSPNFARARASLRSSFYCLTKVETARRLLWLHHSNMNQKTPYSSLSFRGYVLRSFWPTTVRQRKFSGKTLGAALSPHFCEYPCVLVWQLLATMEQIFCCFPCFQVWGKQALPGQLQELSTDRCEKSCCFEITRFQLQKTIFISNNKNRNSFAFALLVYISFFSLLLSACCYYLSKR